MPTNKNPWGRRETERLIALAIESMDCNGWVDFLHLERTFERNSRAIKRRLTNNNVTYVIKPIGAIVRDRLGDKYACKVLSEKRVVYT